MTAIRKFLSGVVVDSALGDRQIRAVASTAKKDRQGDIVEPHGCVLDNWKANPVVLLQHDPNVPVGTGRVEIVNNRVEVVITFADPGISAKADEVCGLAKNGIVRGVSIGFQSIASEPLPDGGLRFTKWDLLEISMVSVPANAEALIIERSFRGREKSTGATGDNGVDHLQAIVAALAGAKRAAKTGIASHEATLDHLAAMGGWMVDGHRHAQALARAGLMGPDHPFGSADETGEPQGIGGDDPDVELAARAARRKSALGALDRANVGAVAARKPPAEIGGGFLTRQVRAQAQDLIWRAYR